jgi:hypothetical protein
VATAPAASSPDGTASASGDGAGSDDARVDDAIDISSKFRHAHDDEPPPPLGPSHTSYWSDLAAQVHSAWLVSTAFPVAYAATGCLHISPGGKVVAVKLDHPSGDAEVDASVEHALAEVQRARNEHPVIVPTDQLPIITRWVCFRFNP